MKKTRLGMPIVIVVMVGPFSMIRGSVSEMSLPQMSCVVACDLWSLLVPFMRDVLGTVLVVGMSGMEKSMTAEANLRGPTYDQKFGRDCQREEFGPSVMWSTYSSRVHHLRRLLVYDRR